MNLPATRSLLRYAILLLPLLCAPTLAHAQPADDPGFSEPPPPKPAPPPPAPKPTSTITQKSAPVAPPVYVPPPPELRETKDTQVKYIDGGDKAVAAEGDLYERVAAPTLMGQVGLFRTITGDSGRTNTFRVGLHLGGFTQDSFLVAGNGALKGDSNSRFQGDLTIGYTPWKYIEAYLGIYNASNRNVRTDTGRTDPEVILSLGDLALGVKGRYPVAPFMDLALHLGVRFNNSVSGISFDGNSTNFAVDAIASWDLRHAQATRNVPLRFHLNFGFYLDNSLALLPAGQCGRSTGNDPCIRSRVVETFAYGIGSSRLRIALAVDAPVLIRTVGLQPLIEYHADIAVGDGDTTIKNALKNDPSVPGDRLNGTASQYLTLGLRLRPVAGLVLDLGLDVGLGSPGFVYGPPVPQWNLMAGAAYAYDAAATKGKTKLVTTTITRELTRGPITGKVRGIVRDAKTKKAIGGATIRYTNRRETPQMSNDDGSFVSYALVPGPLSLEISREDYDTLKVETNVYANADLPVEVLLVAKPPSAGQLRGHITDTNGQPVAATVRLTSTTGAIIDADLEGAGTFSAKLPGGDYTMDVVANGYLAKQRLVIIQSGQVQTVDLVLTKKPATARVTLGKGEITVKGVVHFGTNDAQLKPDAEQLLDEVADVIIRNPQLKKIRVEGHTDNRGNADKNLDLSRGRAAAVVAYLVKSGVDPTRLTSEGYGATQPLVPNLTPANRARNRRVAFKILDQVGGMPSE